MQTPEFLKDWEKYKLTDKIRTPWEKQKYARTLLSRMDDIPKNMPTIKPELETAIISVAPQNIKITAEKLGVTQQDVINAINKVYVEKGTTDVKELQKQVTAELKNKTKAKSKPENKILGMPKMFVYITGSILVVSGLIVTIRYFVIKSKKS